VSHYLLSRALEWALLKPERRDHPAHFRHPDCQAFLAGQGDAVITWDGWPDQATGQVSQVFSSPGSRRIVDLTVVNSSQPPAELGKALTLGSKQRLMGMPCDAGRMARAKMASAAGLPPGDFNQQLDPALVLFAARYALALPPTKDAELMLRVTSFADQQKLLGNDVKLEKWASLSMSAAWAMPISCCASMAALCNLKETLSKSFIISRNAALRWAAPKREREEISTLSAANTDAGEMTGKWHDVSAAASSVGNRLGGIAAAQNVASQFAIAD
jgi:hypothetical protein